MAKSDESAGTTQADEVAGVVELDDLQRSSGMRLLKPSRDHGIFKNWPLRLGFLFLLYVFLGPLFSSPDDYLYNDGLVILFMVITVITCLSFFSFTDHMKILVFDEQESFITDLTFVCNSLGYVLTRTENQKLVFGPGNVGPDRPSSKCSCPDLHYSAFGGPILVEVHQGFALVVANRANAACLEENVFAGDFKMRLLCEPPPAAGDPPSGTSDEEDRSKPGSSNSRPVPFWVLGLAALSMAIFGKRGFRSTKPEDGAKAGSRNASPTPFGTSKSMEMVEAFILLGFILLSLYSTWFFYLVPVGLLLFVRRRRRLSRTAHQAELSKLRSRNKKKTPLMFFALGAIALSIMTLYAVERKGLVGAVIACESLLFIPILWANRGRSQRLVLAFEDRALFESEFGQICAFLGFTRHESKGATEIYRTTASKGAAFGTMEVETRDNFAVVRLSNVHAFRLEMAIQDKSPEAISG